MPATCKTCDTHAGPTIRVTVDTIQGPVQLALTPQQARDLIVTVHDYVVLPLVAGPPPE